MKAYDPHLKLGVELEVEIQNDPNPFSGHTSIYKIYGSYPKHQLIGTMHVKHGWLVEIADGITDKIQTHYDNTVNDGWEWIGRPMTLEENKDEWGELLEDETLSKYIHGDDVKQTPGKGYGIHDCGMHVHVSGDPINKDVMGKLLLFINATRHLDFIELMAGRKLNKFCKTQPGLTAKDGSLLWHSEECSKHGKRIKYVNENETWDIFEDRFGGYCCDNAMAFQKKNFKRGAIWVTPAFGTGDFEIRIFKSTVKVDRFFANLEFVVALIEFLSEIDEKKVTTGEFCGWLERLENRVKYSYLFRFLRKNGWVDGIIPKQETVKDLIAKGKLQLALGKVA